jgi:hypothetical protein
MKPMMIDLHIEELILRDLPYAQRYRIAAAVEQELQRLLTERGVPEKLAHGGSIPRLRVGPLSVAEDAKPGVIGARIAEEMYVQLAGGEMGQQEEKGAS